MTMNHDLAKQIEELVRQHVDALRTAAAAAVARAFAAALPREVERASAPTKPVRRAAAAPRRAPEELVALGERFYAVLCRQPGETMATLAPQVGVAPRVLQVAVARLRRAGRVRVVGQRQLARYFPMVTASTATASVSAAA
jgi:cytochrome c5